MKFHYNTSGILKTECNNDIERCWMSRTPIPLTLGHPITIFAVRRDPIKRILTTRHSRHQWTLDFCDRHMLRWPLFDVVYLSFARLHTVIPVCLLSVEFPRSVMCWLGASCGRCIVYYDSEVIVSENRPFNYCCLNRYC